MSIHPKNNCISSSITKIPICIKDNRDYRKLALKLHPDKNSDCIDSATEKFKKLNNNKNKQEETYGILSQESFHKCIKQNGNNFNNVNNFNNASNFNNATNFNNASSEDEGDINSFDNALDKYYELKSEYNERVRERGMLHKREHNVRCINCNQIGKTIFTTDVNGNNENNVRVLKAVCGCKNPCNLNIELVLGSYVNIFEEIDKYKEQLKQVKNDIIIYKNDIMFDANKEGDADHFEKLKTRLNETFTHLNKIYDKLFEIENTNEDENIKELQFSMNDEISKIKEDVLSNEYDNAVKIYIDELEPILKELREKTYAICEVDKHIERFGILKIKVTYTLIQEKYAKNAFVIEMTPPEIVRFITKRNGVNADVPVNNNVDTNVSEDNADASLNMKIFENSNKTAYVNMSKISCKVLKEYVMGARLLLQTIPDQVKNQQILVAFASEDISKKYVYSGVTLHTHSTLAMQNFLKIVNSKLNTSFNSILMKKYISEIPFATADVDNDNNVVDATGGSVTIFYGFGRVLRICNKTTNQLVKNVKIAKCCVLQMGGNFQELYTYEVPVVKNEVKNRITFTFLKV